MQNLDHQPYAPNSKPCDLLVTVPLREPLTQPSQDPLKGTLKRNLSSQTLRPKLRALPLNTYAPNPKPQALRLNIKDPKP